MAHRLSSVISLYSMMIPLYIFSMRDLAFDGFVLFPGDRRLHNCRRLATLSHADDLSDLDTLPDSEQSTPILSPP